ncbi:MAG: phosphatase PAP2 family protein [Olsenella sp.]|nr:phosphatase PAP2 family protein [Olsenella sp.]MCI1289775.1 phosphatase PAP2 family protein [Olsenella sp.]
MATDRARRTAAAGGGMDLVVGIACGLGFVALAVLVCGGATAQADGAALALVASARTAWLTHAFLLVTNALSPMVLVAVAVMATLALALFRGRVLLNLIALGGACALNVVLKAAFCRPRPEAFMLVAESGYSFPSGHAMVCTTVAALAWLASRPRLGARGRAILAAVCTASVVLVCASRVYLGAHYLSDVAAGVLAALAWVALAHRLVGRTGRMALPARGTRPADAR